MKKSFNIQQLLQHKSKCHGTKPMHPCSSRAFQRHQEHDQKHPSLVDLITAKRSEASQFGGSHHCKTRQNKTGITNTLALPIDKMLYMCIYVCMKIHILFCDLFVCVCVYVHLCVIKSFCGIEW